jgi:hypothetical protein
MREQRDALEAEFAEPVLDGLDAEARAPVQAFARRKDAAEDIRRRVLSDAAHVLGAAFMGRLFDGWPLTHPPQPQPPGPFTVDRMRPLVAAIEPAKPKRVRRARKAKASAGDAA